ncbi:MAG: MBL fold metallo-hydrolase [Phycisphaerales bacterium]|jgi:phosphoribosyl 1,2-cyclic phosphate phosphodiesterase|nr:MBL fold metallo-hydrolase [Phycisphaerales bacterium]
MRFEFLGTGTSAGIPTIGCHCAVCTSSDPHDARLRTSGLIRFEDAGGQERAILIDAGPDLRQQSLRAGLERLDAILLTHNHVDHTWGLDEVRRFNVLAGGAPIDLWADRHTLDFARRVYQHIFEPHRNIQASFVASLLPRELRPMEAIDLFGMIVTPLALLHGRLPILGFRFDPSRRLSDAIAARTSQSGASEPWWPLAYLTDVSGIPPETWPALSGVRTLVLDALRHRHHPTHYTLDQAVGVAERVGAQQTFFVHMSHDLPHRATNESLPDGMRLAHDGLVLGAKESGAEGARE